MTIANKFGETLDQAHQIDPNLAYSLEHTLSVAHAVDPNSALAWTKDGSGALYIEITFTDASSVSLMLSE